VERLAKVDPSVMTHEEKLAFWINLYNALLMHVSAFAILLDIIIIIIIIVFLL